MRKYSTEVWDEISEQYKNGDSTVKLGLLYGLSKPAMLRQFRKRGIQIRDWNSGRDNELRSRYIDGKKTCPECKTLKSPDEFYKDVSRLDRLNRLCKSCHNERSKKYKKSLTLEQIQSRRERERQYRQSEKGKRSAKSDSHFHSRMPSGRFSNSRARARRIGIGWTIEKADYFELIKNSCEYCGGPLPVAGAGLDRLDNSFGYHLDNVVPCCTICNLSRRNHFTPEEMRRFVGPAIRTVREARAVDWKSLVESTYSKGDVLKGKIPC